MICRDFIYVNILQFYIINYQIQKKNVPVENLRANLKLNFDIYELILLCDRL